MDAVFVDDSAQRNPSRAGVGALLAAGALYVPGDAVRQLEADIDEACREAGFPANEEFKWSPEEGQWMRRGLVRDDRRDFFLACMDLARDAGARVSVVIEDTTKQPAVRDTAEEDVVVLLLERIGMLLDGLGRDAIVMFDRPPGDRAAESAFLAHAIETARTGTRYVLPSRVALVAATSSKLVRLLQLVDVVVSATTSCVSGEPRYAPPIFNAVRPLLREELGRVGGVGLKIHPDWRYANLYHWLAGDELFVRYPTGIGLPSRMFPYAQSPDQP